MQNLQHLLSWLAENRLAAATFIFSGAAVAVMVYTYVVDYRSLTQQD